MVTGPWFFSIPSHTIDIPPRPTYQQQQHTKKGATSTAMTASRPEVHVGGNSQRKIYPAAFGNLLHSFSSFFAFCILQTEGQYTYGIFQLFFLIGNDQFSRKKFQLGKLPSFPKMANVYYAAKRFAWYRKRPAEKKCSRNQKIYDFGVLLDKTCQVSSFQLFFHPKSNTISNQTEKKGGKLFIIVWFCFFLNFLLRYILCSYTNTDHPEIEGKRIGLSADTCLFVT